MLSIIVFPILLPLVGAVAVVGISLVPRLRIYTRYVALAVACCAGLLVLVAGWIDPAAGQPVSWRPSQLFGVDPLLRSDGVVRPLALAWTVAICGAGCVGLGRGSEGARPAVWAFWLALFASAIASLWAATPLTMIIAWACYDLLRTAGYVADGGSVRIAARGLVFGMLATLVLWLGALLSLEGGGSALWDLMDPGPAPLTLWMVAGLLRLCIFPFHLSMPDDLGEDPVEAAWLLAPVLGWGLYLRLASANGGELAGGPWVLTLAAVTVALGGFLAWSSGRGRSLAWIGVGCTGGLLLGAGLAGEQSVAVIAAGAAAWVLSMTILHLTDGLRREKPWWSIPAAVAALALLGFPFTLGFSPQSVLLGGLVQASLPGWGVLFFIGTPFLVTAMVRLLLSPADSAMPERVWMLVLSGLGLGLPALLLLVAGFYPPLLEGASWPFSLAELFTAPGVGGWVLWAVALTGGGILVWQDANIRPRANLLLSAVHDLVRFEWVYEIGAGALDQGFVALRAADELVGGAGAILWSLVLFLLIVLVWSGG